MLTFFVGFLFLIRTRLCSISWFSKSSTMGTVTTCSFRLLNQRPSSVLELPASTVSQHFIPTVFDRKTCDLYPIPLNTSCLHLMGKYGGGGVNHEGKWGKAFLRHNFFIRLYPPVQIRPGSGERALLGKNVGHTQHGYEAIPRICSSQIWLWRKVVCVIREEEG